jgi:two-component system sensor histidine kinase YesM
MSLTMKLILLFSSIVLPLSITIFFVNDYAIRLLKTQATESNQNMLQISLSQVEDALNEKYRYLTNLAFLNESVRTLGMQGEESSSYHYAKSNLKYSLMEGIASDPWVDGFFVYLADSREFVTTSLNVANYEERMQGFHDLEQTLSQKTEVTADSGWYSELIAGKQRLIRVIRSLDNVYVAVVVNVDSMEEMSRLRQLDISGEIVALSNSGDILTSSLLSPEWKQTMEEVVENKEQYKETKMQSDTFLLFMERSEAAGISIIKRLPEKQLLRQMSHIHNVIRTIPLGIIVALFVLLVIIRQVVLKPIHILLNGMRKIKEGNWNHRLKEGRNKEFILINATFNEMVEQINALKIDIYEEKLRGQTTEIQRLQLQIHPHFLLNSLNMVYNLAQKREYSLIQKMTKHLMDYFRSMLYKQSEKIKLSDEAAHIENYLEIQSMRFAGHLDYRIQIDPLTTEIDILPMIFQPIVENTIIHGLTMGKERFLVAITINSTRMNGREWLEIIVEDNGRGFSEQALAQLQSHDASINMPSRVGVKNIRERLKLHYGSDANLVFENIDPHGARVRMSFPLK